MRGALLAVCLVLSACGGGGSDQPAAPVVSAPAPAVPAAPQAPAPVTAQANVAVWGDSLTQDYGPELQPLMAPRLVFKGGIASQTSTQIADRFMADTQHRSWVTVLWYGRNNFSNPAQVLADLARSTQALTAAGNDKFIVLAVLNSAAEVRGSASYVAIQQLNATIAATYPEQFFDMRAYLVGSFDAQNPQDVIDHGNDVSPSSLRRDTLHMNAAGQDVLAKKVQELIAAHGW